MSLVEAGVEHRFGPYGGQYVPETLMPALGRARARRGSPRARTPATAPSSAPCCATTPGARRRCISPSGCRRSPAARSGSSARTSCTPARTRSTTRSGRRCWRKPHGQARIIAETGAGQHGVASATACALLDLECVVYMGAEDIRRQAPNVQRMKLLGAEVVCVEAGARTLKEAVSEAIRDWVTTVATSHYIIGSAVGPAPYPALVRDLQRVIGDESRAALLERAGRLPDRVHRLRRRWLELDRHLHAVRRRRRGRARRRRGRGRGPGLAGATARR